MVTHQAADADEELAAQEERAASRARGGISGVVTTGDNVAVCSTVGNGVG